MCIVLVYIYELINVIVMIDHFHGKKIAAPHLDRHLIIVASWHMTIDTVIADRGPHDFRLPAV